MERAQFRSKQNSAADCNQAGQLVDAAVAALGGAVQAHPSKPMLKPPGTNHLKLKHDNLLSIVL